MNKLEAAQEAIDDFFGDTTVSKHKTLEGLIDLQADLDNKIDCITGDIEREEREGIEEPEED